MRLDATFIEQVLNNPIKIQYMLFPEVDSDLACAEMHVAINRNAEVAWGAISKTRANVNADT